MIGFGVNPDLYRPLTPAQLTGVRALATRASRRQAGRIAQLKMMPRLDQSHAIRTGAC